MIYDNIKDDLKNNPKTWLITGVAGFIGSNLLEELLNLNQIVIGLDNFSTGHKKNLDLVEANSSESCWNNFHFIEGDIRSYEDCLKALNPNEDKKLSIDYVLHQAALGSVPRSIEDPITSNDVNIGGFLKVLDAAQKSSVKSFVYAASSATYGDHKALPKVESIIGNQLSPYAVTKRANELYAWTYSSMYKIPCTGLRYFNVFGPRQDPDGAYAAVIPKWIELIKNNKVVIINGDGETSRDFCFIQNVIQANILAAVKFDSKLFKKDEADVPCKVVNIACGEQTTLNELYQMLFSNIKKIDYKHNERMLEFGDFREGDVRHSLADITKARDYLSYEVINDIKTGLKITTDWFLKN